MSSSEGSHRGTRSHATPSSSRSSSRSTASRSSSSRTSTSRSRSTSRPPVAKRPSRPPVRNSSTTRRPAPTTSPFESFIVSVWHWTKMSFTGEVPASMRSSKIPSVEAHHRVKNRLRLTVVLFILALTALLGRVVLLQTIQGDAYYEASVEQRTRVNILRAARGVIFDRNGNELALSVPSTTVYADPRDITDVPAVARALSVALAHTPEQEARLLAALSAPGSKFSYIARGLTKENAQTLLGLGLPGVYSYKEPSRQVEGGVAGAVIGRTDPDGLGTSGLEKQFNTILTGVDGKGIREVDKNGRSIAGVQSTTAAPVPGDDIVLTLDKNIQFQTDTALLDRVGQLSAKGGTAIVMDSMTGHIYAMSNVRRNAAGSAVLASGNFAAVEAYEPGSVAKVFSVSAALNEGVVTPETVLQVPGSIIVDKFPIRDAWPHPTMDMNVRMIISESSNIGTLKTAEKITSNKLHDYLSAFGFGQKTGLDYPGESRGTLRDANKWRGTEKVTVSYGYGMAATPLQLIAGVNTVANKGTYVAPQLVSATIDKAGKRHPVPESATHSVLKPETAASMTEMLREVICTGTGELAQVKGMEIAGKTGTGYKVQSNGTYSTDAGGRKYFASFVGYFPAANPRVTMLISIDEPDASSRDRFGGTAAATVFARLVPGVMHELGIQATGSGTGCKAGAKSAGH
ncbi:MAG: penicillin-binding protein 2 [Ilumatobacteraceae bacterium]|nr:penicillin-binding protein 2 [Ilumatobacteraceae bacterium]MDP5069161.1 penicillin-binding protein 2 [Ilumatobacteraceae bacterium]